MAIDKRTKKIEHKIDTQVFDHSTMVTLYKLIKGKYVDDILGAISIGKEANVYKAFYKGETRAVKIYRIETSSFDKMAPYIIGDPRFQVKKTKKDIVYVWAKKEFRNLRRAYKAKVTVPRPYKVLKNVLVMEFISESEQSKEPAPLLKNAKFETKEDAQDFFDEILDNMKKLYKADLVHGDLSEFNVMVSSNRPVLFDFGQAVVLEHPNSMEFLQRDAEKMAKFFNKHGLNLEAEKLVKSIKQA